MAYTNKIQYKGIGYKIIKGLIGVIIGLVCFPCICMIIQDEKKRASDSEYRKERRREKK